jgi:hypothetical protein
MDTVSAHLAFQRFGADIGGQHRPLSATARDGSLVLVCVSSGFSRPDVGVLRYSAKLSLLAAGRPQIEALRVGLGAASAEGTAVRLIIHTPGLNKTSGRMHVRADLVGSVTAFDGDAYCVDFVRPPAPQPERPPGSRRRR